MVNRLEQVFSYILLGESVILVFELFKLTLEIAKLVFLNVLLEELVISVLFFVEFLVFDYLSALGDLVEGIVCSAIEE